MDDVFNLILGLFYRVITVLMNFKLSFNGLSISLFDFFITIIVLNALFRVLFVLPSNNKSSSSNGGQSERNDE